MKNISLLMLLNLATIQFTTAQNNIPTNEQQKSITALIDHYSEARENRDTVLLKNILTADIDQLVSSGEWRTGIGAAVEGMQKSSAGNPGTRTLTINSTRMLSTNTAIVDCRYEIESSDHTKRKMWSSFIVVADDNVWKITAIRNMLPAGQ
ncbi:hypothetical protein BH11BAC3_BH11BAC3_13680 [soil metagenome]